MTARRRVAGDGPRRRRGAATARARPASSPFGRAAQPDVPRPGLLVNIDVDDLERGIDFYARGLGLEPGRRLGPRACEMLGAPAAIYLLEQPAGTRPFAGSEGRRDYVRHWTPVHLDLVVEDLEPAVDRALSAGGRLEGPIQERPWGRLARMSDPFGHGFCLLQFKGRGYDAIATGPSR